MSRHAHRQVDPNAVCLLRQSKIRKHPGKGQHPGNQSKTRNITQARKHELEGDIQQGLRNKDRNKPGIYRQVITILTGNWLSAMINDQGQLSAMSSDETNKTKGNVVLRWGDAKGK